MAQRRGAGAVAIANEENIAFEIADAQTAEWDPIYDYAFSRMGTLAAA